MSDMGDESALEIERLDQRLQARMDEARRNQNVRSQDVTGTEDARYLWRGIVWRPGRTVPVRSSEPPEFVLAFRSGTWLLERQAPAADGSSLWTWVDHQGAVMNANQPWGAATEDLGTLEVARVKNGDGDPVRIGTALHEAVERMDVVRPEPLPFSPFPRPVPRPAEPEVGTVIGFAKQFNEDGPMYSFAAIHAVKGQWYLSGPQYGGRSLSWDELLDFIGGPLEWARVGAVGSWDRLEDL